MELAVLRVTLCEFEPFCERHQDGMFNVAKSVTNNSEDAEDAVQTAFQRIFGVLGSLSFKTECAEKSYALRAAHNAAIDLLRAKSKLEVVSSEDMDDVACSTGDVTFAAVAADETAEELEQAVKRLSPKAQAIFKFREMRMGDVEIAATLGITVSDVRTTVFRARRKISALLEEGGLRHE